MRHPVAQKLNFAELCKQIVHELTPGHWNLRDASHSLDGILEG